MAGRTIAGAEGVGFDGATGVGAAPDDVAPGEVPPWAGDVDGRAFQGSAGAADTLGRLTGGTGPLGRLPGGEGWPAGVDADSAALPGPPTERAGGTAGCGAGVGARGDIGGGAIGVAERGLTGGDAIGAAAVGVGADGVVPTVLELIGVEPKGVDGRTGAAGLADGPGETGAGAGAGVDAPDGVPHADALDCAGAPPLIAAADSGARMAPAPTKSSSITPDAPIAITPPHTEQRARTPA